MSRGILVSGEAWRSNVPEEYKSYFEGACDEHNEAIAQNNLDAYPTSARMTPNAANTMPITQYRIVTFAPLHPNA